MDINKQYADVCGIPILARTLRVFQECDSVDSIVVVVNENDIIYCKQNIIVPYGIDKTAAIVAGGETRQRSVYNGLTAIDLPCDIIAIHDGARPFIVEDIIDRGISTAFSDGAACTAVPVKDTIKSADPEGLVVETLDRSILWSVQTPQTFRYDVIMQAHNKALENCFEGTDDAVLVERLGYRMKLVMGAYDNIKITTQEDLVFAEGILKARDTL